MGSPVKMIFSSRQAGYSNRQQGPKNLEICRVLESDKCEVSGRYFVVGGHNSRLPAHFDWAVWDALVI